MLNKRLQTIFIVIYFLSLYGCVTASYFNGKYFGTIYPATSNVVTYYDARDIKQDYRVIGHFAAPVPAARKFQDQMTLKIIEQAKKVGADGLIFSSINVTKHDGLDDYSLNADAIKFTK